MRVHHQMLYLESNSDIPRNVVTSTARKGRKWFDKVKPGDLLELRTTEGGRVLGTAAVVVVERATYLDVLMRADENHTGQRPGLLADPRDVLADELTAAYGAINPTDEFSMVHFVVLNQ